MQILHPFPGSIQLYQAQLADPDRHRPDRCPQCQAKHPLTSHGFYTRTLIDTVMETILRIRRYLCQFCKRTVSLLPQFCLPYLRSSISVIALFLVARLLHHQTLNAAATAAHQPSMPYQRGQFWLRRFTAQAATLCAALAAITKPTPATGFVTRALTMLQSAGWTAAHRFLFGQLRHHLLGWPRSLAPGGRRVTIATTAAPV